MLINDPRFKVEVVTQTPQPQQSMYVSMHQCYCEGEAFQEVLEMSKSEAWFGEMLVKHLLAGGRGHYGITQDPAITFSVIGFPHSVMQQARTHRIGVSFAVQSGRYTSDRFEQYPHRYSLEDLVYLRPLGEYKDRQGNNYDYSADYREKDLYVAEICVRHYQQNIKAGFAPEQCRSLLPFDFRQNWTVSFNVRSLMHFLDLRAKKDAQLEIQTLCELMFPHFETWVPQIAEWYKTNRWGKARLAP